jgi:GAF domain-containing protein
MNTERLLREVEKRLVHLSEADRAEALDAVREALGRERRRTTMQGTVETERERRAEAETLREILEAINRQASLEQTIEEVLKQLARLVVFDSCSLGLLDPSGAFRVIASRGFPDPSAIEGRAFQSPLSDLLRLSRSAVTIPDVKADQRFLPLAGTESIRSWAGLPLQVEGEVIGVLFLDRHKVEPFEDEDVHRAKAVAFSAAAAIHKAQLLERVRRYAALMERVVQVYEAAFAGRTPADLARLILDGALRVGVYDGGVLVLEDERGPQIAARSDIGAADGVPAAGLLTRTPRHVSAEEAAALAPSVGLTPQPLFLVPIATPDVHVGTLVLGDANGESPDDRLMESYASRAASAWVHATRKRPAGH